MALHLPIGRWEVQGEPRYEGGGPCMTSEGGGARYDPLRGEGQVELTRSFSS